MPHNDIWIFSSRASCELLFDAYDELREVGTATTVVGRLDDIVANQSGTEGEEGGGMMMCATKFTSLYPHIMYQGDILELSVYKLNLSRPHWRRSLAQEPPTG